MTIKDIGALWAADELRTGELKKRTRELKDDMRAGCAFLNTEGGCLIFDVAHKSLKIVGDGRAASSPSPSGVPQNST